MIKLLLLSEKVGSCCVFCEWFGDEFVTVGPGQLLRISLLVVGGFLGGRCQWRLVTVQRGV